MTSREIEQDIDSGRITYHTEVVRIVDLMRFPFDALSVKVQVFRDGKLAGAFETIQPIGAPLYDCMIKSLIIGGKFINA